MPGRHRYVQHGRDANHGPVMAKFHALCPVVEDHSQGNHGYDAIIRTSRGTVYVVEIKDGRRPPSERRLTDNEKAAMSRWGWQFALVESEQDAEDLALERGRKNSRGVLIGEGT